MYRVGGCIDNFGGQDGGPSTKIVNFHGFKLIMWVK
jgi:hypothetical protein